MYLGLDRAHFLSSSGQCKSFDASADGYCRAEGCGVFVIKKLSDALAEGDRVHAVIKAVEINQSGNTHSITHPHIPTQEALFADIFRKTDIHPHEVSTLLRTVIPRSNFSYRKKKVWHSHIFFNRSPWWKCMGQGKFQRRFPTAGDAGQAPGLFT